MTPPRRWSFRFSLRTLFVVVGVLALAIVVPILGTEPPMPVALPAIHYQCPDEIAKIPSKHNAARRLWLDVLRADGVRVRPAPEDSPATQVNRP